MVTATAREENGEFCADSGFLAGPLRPGLLGILTQLVKAAGCKIEPADLGHILA